MLEAHPTEGDETPNYQSMKKPRDRSVTHHARLQDDFRKYSPEPLRNRPGGKLPGLRKVRQKPLLNRASKQPQAYRSNREEYGNSRCICCHDHGEQCCLESNHLVLPGLWG